MLIFPSLISADLLNLERVIHRLEPYSDGWHIDIMDNHFVPNLTWGSAFANAINAISTRQMWVHLMVSDPLSIMEKLTISPKSILSFHIETKYDVEKLICFCKEKGWRASIAISPKTNVEEAFPFLTLGVTQVLVMSVEPGFSGQEFIPEVMHKVTLLEEFKNRNGLDFSIAMDGGITEKNLGMLATYGVSHAAIAAGIFASTDPVSALKKLRKIK